MRVLRKGCSLFFFQFVSKLSAWAVEIRRDTFKLPALYFQFKICSVLTTYIIIIMKSLSSEYNWQLACAVTAVKRAGDTQTHTENGCDKWYICLCSSFTSRWLALLILDFPSTIFNIKRWKMKKLVLLYFVAEKMRTASDAVFCGEFMGIRAARGFFCTCGEKWFCKKKKKAPSYSAELLLDLCKDTKNLFALYFLKKKKKFLPSPAVVWRGWGWGSAEGTAELERHSL